MIKAVIFDMDGTLTVPTIDWVALRAAIKAPPECTIIEHIAGLPADEAARAETILKRVELEGTVGCDLNEGAHEVLAVLRERGVGTAVVTNNHREAMHAVIEAHGLRFDTALCRDDGLLKPAPDLLNLALHQLGCGPDEAVSIGDSRYDLAASAAARVPFVYLAHGDNLLQHEPAVSSLRGFLEYLELT